MQGKKIRELRMALGLTQSQFSERLNVSKSAVTNWEYGKNEISRPMLEKIARVFGANPAFLAGNSEIMFVPPDEDEELIDAALAGGDPLIRALLLGIVKKPDGWRMLAESVIACADYLRAQGIDPTADEKKPGQ